MAGGEKDCTYESTAYRFPGLTQVLAEVIAQMPTGPQPTTTTTASVCSS